MRILIIGASGVGKTTVARKLQDEYRLPLIELDDYFGGKRPEQKKADEIVAKVLKAHENWIIEGVYLFPRLFSTATHIVFIEVPFLVALFRAWKRYFLRRIRRENIYGNKSLFLTTKHILKMYFSRGPLTNYKSFRVWKVRELSAKYPEKNKSGRFLLLPS